MLPCHGCAYRREIPGDCHSRCVFDWIKHADLAMPSNAHSARTQRWFRFPYNFDPVWGQNECAGRADTADPDSIAQAHPLLDLLSLLR
jgi:hypothetical protein